MRESQKKMGQPTNHIKTTKKGGDKERGKIGRQSLIRKIQGLEKDKAGRGTGQKGFGRSGRGETPANDKMKTERKGKDAFTPVAKNPGIKGNKKPRGSHGERNGD